MKKQLQKKFNAYQQAGMAFIIMMMFSIVTVNAQIVYTDVNPDVAVFCYFSGSCSGDYSIDLNNDGINDFTLSPRKRQIGCSCGSHGGHGGAAGPWTDIDSAVIISTSSSWIADTAGGYALNSLIDSSLGWTNALHVLAKLASECQTCSSGGANLVSLGTSGNWYNINGKYLALKTQVGTNYYYGWVKLGVSITQINQETITIMEYAYNSIPNQPILAGQTSTTGIIENSFASSINIFPNPANNHITIALGSNNKKVEVSIADITGKIIYTTIVTDTQKVEVNTNDFANGIYVVQIQAADLIGTRKLVIEK
jgi:hypothetical protein